MNEFDLDFKAFLRRHRDLSWKTTAVLLRCDRRTRNGNIYPRAVMERAIAEYHEGIGHIAHEPDDLTGAAFIVNNLRIVADEVRVDYKVLDTQAGQRLAHLMRAGVQIAFSTEGQGSVDANGVVQNDFRLTGVVVHPHPPEP